MHDSYNICTMAPFGLPRHTDHTQMCTFADKQIPDICAWGFQFLIHCDKHPSGTTRTKHETAVQPSTPLKLLWMPLVVEHDDDGTLSCDETWAYDCRSCAMLFPAPNAATGKTESKHDEAHEENQRGV